MALSPNMQKLKCPLCGSENLVDDMITIYGLGGELFDTEQVKKCTSCGEIIRAAGETKEKEG